MLPTSVILSRAVASSNVRAAMAALTMSSTRSRAFFLSFSAASDVSLASGRPIAWQNFSQCASVSISRYIQRSSDVR
ncbi:hypothetical protein D3C72_1777560 [compost metagenome]